MCTTIFDSHSMHDLLKLLSCFWHTISQILYSFLYSIPYYFSHHFSILSGLSFEITILSSKLMPPKHRWIKRVRHQYIPNDTRIGTFLGWKQVEDKNIAWKWKCHHTASRLDVWLTGSFLPCYFSLITELRVLQDPSTLPCESNLYTFGYTPPKTPHCSTLAHIEAMTGILHVHVQCTSL